MTSAKDIVLKQIDSKTARDFVRRVHYSGKVAQNSQIHLGVFLGGALHGAMQFGPSLDKRKIQGLVEGTHWHEFLELNRLAFDDMLPRNSESRALSIAFKLLKKHAPQIKWIISFADATQCGDGTIYRASGFLLTGINPSSSAWILPNGESVRENTIRQSGYTSWLRPFMSESKFNELRAGGSKSAVIFRNIEGAEKLPGFQLRYIYFINKAYRERLTVPELPFSEIEKRGAKMYKGQAGG
ncbi:MAG: hypothetical protein GY774_39985 [Planctomycetes bacterium]|nr:hypothetical protein [Planctomycetota bacterium]